MYKLLIVDDEEEVRKGIIQKIDWSRSNFVIAGEAENGREALELIEESIPDVVITDITMPLMDGLGLAKIIHDSYPTVKTVILTGYDDFKFAQQAIKYGVADYILKPVLPEDIEELLGKLKDRIDAEIAQKEDIVRLRRHYNESLPIIRDKFLTLLITGRQDEKEIRKRLDNLNLKIDGDTFVVAAAGIDASSFKNNVFEENDIELVKFAVFNISEEIVEKHSFGEVFFHDDYLIFIAGFREQDNNEVLGKTFSVLEEIRQSAEKYLKISITAGIGRISNSLALLRDSYKSAVTALDYKLVIGGDKVIYIDDLEPQTTSNLVFDENKEKALVSGIKFGTQKEVSEAVDAIFDDISGEKVSFKEFQLYMIELAAAISRLTHDFQLDTAEVFGAGSNLYEEIFKFQTAEELKSWIEDICIKLMKHISSKRQNTTEMLLEKAKNYMLENYGDEEMSIQKVADYLHISQSYLSLIFKKDAGVTFLKYLVGIRLEAAKDLLVNSDLKTTEIAEKIGYPDINYFSYFFKKNFGVSPREYRSKFISQKKETRV